MICRGIVCFNLAFVLLDFNKRIHDTHNRASVNSIKWRRQEVAGLPRKRRSTNICESGTAYVVGGYWHQWADERLGDPPPPKVDPRAFSGQRQGWRTPGSVLLLCV